MSEPLVRIEINDKVALIRMDDGRANALGHPMLEALGAALDRAESEASAAVLIGRTGRFSAGFDLATMMSSPEAARGLVRAGADLLMRLYALPMPLVVACSGHALAGGALMLLTGDTRVGAEGAFKIGLNEVSIGMPLPIFAEALARDRLDPRALTAATIQATIYDPQGAAAAGYLDRVVGSEAVENEALREASRLTELSQRAYAMTKASLRSATIERIRSTLEADMARLTQPSA